MSVIKTPDSNDFIQLYQKYDISKNISDNILNKYDFTKCLGLRTTQIAKGAEPLIKLTPDLNEPLLIALEEIKQRKCPFILEKKMGDITEYWKLEDLVLEDEDIIL